MQYILCLKVICLVFWIMLYFQWYIICNNQVNGKEKYFQIIFPFYWVKAIAIQPFSPIFCSILLKIAYSLGSLELSQLSFG